ncbi:hypothetical protein CI102_13404 [Trichoderma harzianum]|uniref:Uncharacterized protein n=1 Tax=Trichoderma harzianum CBS 226.95 TaxID=983964 RepID=A0A2T4A4E4_TRIHA|nr:hypothetical protein M431DRAFT_230208 [Trichoderma harzianum CBS 226.95]PKK42073.1 hypothetical protein CI102_13404 [Trichoderma harzianum]PTB51940.1 hypothetical protein M431DRAFT_230208 [Trichoderma harzianum CBS 226.95]
MFGVLRRLAHLIPFSHTRHSTPATTTGVLVLLLLMLLILVLVLALQLCSRSLRWIRHQPGFVNHYSSLRFKSTLNSYWHRLSGIAMKGKQLSGQVPRISQLHLQGRMRESPMGVGGRRQRTLELAMCPSTRLGLAMVSDGPRVRPTSIAHCKR